MGVAALIRRLWNDRVTSSALLLTIGCSLTLLAAGPIYADAVTTGALRRSLTDAPVAEAVVTVESRFEPSEFASIDEVVSGRLADTVRGLGGMTSRSILAADSYELEAADGGDLRGRAEFEWIEGVEQHASIVDGAWPESAVGPVDVAVDQRVGSALGLTVGRRLALVTASTEDDRVDIRISGWYEIEDPTAQLWQQRPVLQAGTRESTSFRTVRFLTSSEPMLTAALSGRLAGSWILLPALDRLDLDDITPIRRRIGALADGLHDATGPPFEVGSALPTLLGSSDRSVSVTESAVIAVVAQLVVLAVYALLLVAGLSVDARSAEAAQFRARGASARQLSVLALVEGVLLVVPAALLAPTIASWGLRVFDEFGPLASIGLAIEPTPNATARRLVTVAAFALVVVLALPAWRAARAAEQPGRHRRQRLRSPTQRAGLDVAVLALAGIAYWQLATLGDDRAATIRGRFGVDPLLIVAPTFGLLAGALIMLRVVPPIARSAEGAIVRSRSIVAALSGWQLARRPTRYGRAGLMLTTAIAIGAFAASYEATWSRSQVDQARHEVGADVRVEPNRRTNDSLTDLFLATAHEAIDGVDRSVPVLRGAATLPGSDRRGLVVALDAERMRLSGGRDDDVIEAGLSELEAQRPTVDGVELPGRPVELAFTIDPEPQPLPRPEPVDDPESGAGDGPPPSPAPAPLPGATVSALIRDGADLLHRVDMGAIALDAPQTVVAELALPTTGGGTIRPRYPVTFVDVEIRTSTTTERSPAVAVQMSDFAVVDEGGARAPLDLPDDRWSADVAMLGGVPDAQPSIQMSSSQPDPGLQFVLETGSSFRPLPIVYTLRSAAPPVLRTLPVIVTTRWLSESRTDIGDEVSVDLPGSPQIRVEVVAAVAAVPTVGAEDEAMIVDLPTWQAFTARPGVDVTPATEHWLTLSDDVDITAALAAPPVEAVTVIAEERLRGKLTSDPPALGIIGALTLGFVAAAVFATVGFVVMTIVSARERRAEFALLTALGLGLGQLRRWMLAEQVALVVISVVFGTAIGVALSALALPLVSLTQDGSPVFPDVAVVYPWRTILGLQAALVAGLVIGSVAVQRFVRRQTISAALRTGDEG